MKMGRQIGFVFVGLPMVVGFSGRIIYDIWVMVDSIIRKEEDNAEYYKQRLIIETAIFAVFILSFLGLYYFM
jgi:hypothetical protein